MSAPACRCGAAKDARYVFCFRCYAKLPYDLRTALRTRSPAADVVRRAEEFLEEDARKQAAKLARLSVNESA